MDGKQLEIKKGEILPLKDRIFRHGMADWQELQDAKYVPKFRFFELSTADKETGYSLSVDWESKTTPEDTIIRIGCTYKTGTDKFKNYENRVIYALEINFLSNMDEIINIIYDPILHLEPKKGLPDNPSHTLVRFDKDKYDDPQNRPAILTELRNHAKDKKIIFDIKFVNKAVKEYRDS